MSLTFCELSIINLTILPVEFPFTMYLVIRPLSFVFITMCPYPYSMALSNIFQKFTYVYTSVGKLNFAIAVLFPRVKFTKIYEILGVFSSVAMFKLILHIPFITSTINAKILYMPYLYIIFPISFPNISISTY